MHDTTLDPLASPLRRPRIVRALAGTLGVLVLLAAVILGAPISAPIVEGTTKGLGIVALFWLMRGEFDNVRDEVDQAVTAEEFAAIRADQLFRTRRIDARAPRVSAAPVDTRNELAFRKRRLRDRGFDPATDGLIVQRREQIATLRHRLPG